MILGVKYCQKRVRENPGIQIYAMRSNELLLRFCIVDLDLILKERRFHWCGHVERSNGAVKRL